ncbi:unnamed protein product, partial [Ectocarpus fasciculatus]
SSSVRLTSPGATLVLSSMQLSRTPPTLLSYKLASEVDLTFDCMASRQIARKEVEVDDVVTQARQGSDRRVLATRRRCAAENELEEALLELTAIQERGRATVELSSKASPLLKQDISTKRLGLLAASPPFILKLEHALVTVAKVDQAGPESRAHTTSRWRSTLKGLMKDASDGIDNFKQLSGREKTSKAVEQELELAAAAARRLSLHVNAWTTAELLQELERIWLQAVQAMTTVDPQFQHVVMEWETACSALERSSRTAQKDSFDGQAERHACATRIRDSQIRAGVGPKAEKAGWWKQRQMRFLGEELRHIERKITPLANPSSLAARYNLLLARCAEVGGWATAVSAYRSARARGVITKPLSHRRDADGPFSLEPLVYQHLLRAAKNASPPQPRAAMLVLREMRLRSEEPAATHYNLVISACARAAAIAASTSALMPLDRDGTEGHAVLCEDRLCQRIEGADGQKKGGNGGAIHLGSGSGGGAVAIENKTLKPGKLGSGHEEGVAGNTLSKGAAFAAKIEVEDLPDRCCLLPTAGDAMECRGAEAAGETWRLALEVIADMRKRGVTPTNVTFKTLVECCRCAAAASVLNIGGDEGLGKGSTPADVYTALKEAGIPARFCYQAGLGNALKGGRCFPGYVAEINR